MSCMAAFSCDIQRAELQYQNEGGGENIFNAKK